MADYLIDQLAQQEIATAIDAAVKEVLSEFPNHGSEEGLTPVLGHALMRQSFDLTDLRVDFNYRQLNKYTEESLAGADGGFLVRIHAPGKMAKKAALFQAKLLKGSEPVRSLKIKSSKEANRLSDQCRGGDFQESCHSLAAIQAAWIKGSAISGSGSSVGLFIHTSAG